MSIDEVVQAVQAAEEHKRLTDGPAFITRFMSDLSALLGFVEHSEIRPRPHRLQLNDESESEPSCVSKHGVAVQQRQMTVFDCGGVSLSLKGHLNVDGDPCALPKRFRTRVKSWVGSHDVGAKES